MGPPAPPSCARGSRCFVVVVSSWHHVRADEDLRSVLPVPPYGFHHGFVSSSRLGPRQRAMVLSFLTVNHVAGGGTLCVCVVRMEGKGCGLPEGLDNSRGRRRPAAVWLLTSCGADGGAPVLLNTRGHSLPLEFKKHLTTQNDGKAILCMGMC